jgi:outer membrane protein
MRLLLRHVLAFAAFAAVLPAQTKVAIINSQLAVSQTAEIKKAQAELEAKFRPRTEALEKLNKEIADLAAQIQAGQGKLTPQAEQSLTAQGQRKERDRQRLQEDLQGDVDRERNDILQRVGNRMQQVVQKLAEARGLDVVIDVQNTVYFKPALDLTKEATAEYDKAYPPK